MDSLYLESRFSCLLEITFFLYVCIFVMQGHCKVPSIDENKLGQPFAQVSYPNIFRASQPFPQAASSSDFGFSFLSL